MTDTIEKKPPVNKPVGGHIAAVESLADGGSSAQPTAFMTCRCCGRYFPRHEAVLDRYCGSDCTHHYAACTNCGRFFTRTESETLCSEECSEEFNIVIMEESL